MKDEKKNPRKAVIQKQTHAGRKNARPEQERRRIEKASQRRKKNRNMEYKLVSAFFVMIFLSLIGYVAYFNIEKSQEFINSPYNTRQNTFADRVVRGDILSSDGEILAYTEVDSDGTEERVYPYGRMFAHAVGYDSNGKSGLESEGNFQLLSSHSFLLTQIKNQLQGKKNMGDTVVSTLDYIIQSTAYEALGNRNGAVIAIEPSTGKILALVSKPDFDPNTLEEEWDSYINDSSNSSLLNRVTNGQYPPGSTFKLVTALDYLREKGSVNSYSFDCEGTVTMNDHSIRCYNGNVHGMEDFEDAFANSCNTAFASMGVSLGAASLRKTAEELLFNQKLPFAGAQKSSFSLDASSGVPLIMQTSIGQGNTLVSPLHMALITCSAANNGVLMKPYLVDSVTNHEGVRISRNKPEVYKRLMANEEASVLRGMMEEVVSRGTASSLSGRAYSVAGKTGSAEFDASGSSHSWFVGYCNAENPDLVVAVIVENGGTGSAAAVPIAGQLFDAYYESQAAEHADHNPDDYSDYEDDASGTSDNGWFDIIEEDYEVFDPEEYEDWEQIFDWDHEDEIFPDPDPQPDIPEDGMQEPEEPPIYEEPETQEPETGNDWTDDTGGEPEDSWEEIYDTEDYQEEALFNISDEEQEVFP